MDKRTVGSAFDHAAESWDNDVVECDMVKTIVRGHAACHVRGVVMPLKKALVIEMKCLVRMVPVKCMKKSSGMSTLTPKRRLPKRRYAKQMPAASTNWVGAVWCV